ncbi:MAG: hypothetical protein AB7F66_15060 [Bacteriovoracia bacterium]
MQKSKHFLAGLIVLASVSLAGSAAATADEGKKTHPKLNKSEVNKCVKALSKKFLVGHYEGWDSMYKDRFTTYCESNGFRLPAYLECNNRIAEKLKTALPDTIPAFCRHARERNAAAYLEYQDCIIDLYPISGFGAFARSHCVDNSSVEARNCVKNAPKDENAPRIFEPVGEPDANGNPPTSGAADPTFRKAEQAKQAMDDCAKKFPKQVRADDDESLNWYPLPHEK